MFKKKRETTKEMLLEIFKESGVDLNNKSSNGKMNIIFEDGSIKPLDECSFEDIFPMIKPPKEQEENNND